MKSYGPLLLIGGLWLGCSSHHQPDETSTDSVATSGVDVGEGLFSFSIDPKTDRKNLEEVIYDGFDREFTELHKSDSLEISNHSMVSNQFFTGQGCLSARILELQLTDRKEGSSLIQWYVIAERPQSFVVFEPVTEDVTERQGTANAALDLGYSAGDDCPVVAIRTSSEGGDIDFSKLESIAFYSVDGGLNEILRLQLEHTVKEGYYNNPDSANITSTIRVFKFVSSDKFPFDVEVDVEDGSARAKERYMWEGTGYKLQQ